MSDAGFVIAGWALTTVVLAAYFARLVLRARRARLDKW